MEDSTSAFVEDHHAAAARLYEVFRTADEDSAILAFQIERDNAVDDVTAHKFLERLLCITYLRGFSRVIDHMEEHHIVTTTNPRILAWAVQSGDPDFVIQQCLRVRNLVPLPFFVSMLDAAISTAYSVGADPIASMLLDKLVALYADPRTSMEVFGTEPRDMITAIWRSSRAFLRCAMSGRFFPTAETC